MTTVAKSVAVNAHGGGAGRIAEGNKTATIYGLIRDQKYAEAIKILNQELANLPKSRAALSLLGYCYYNMQDFPTAASTFVHFY
jgi:tetratricopeptide repeat protein 30